MAQADADEVDFVVLSWVASGVPEARLLSEPFRSVGADRKRGAVERLVAAELMTRAPDGTVARTPAGDAVVAEVNAVGQRRGWTSDHRWEAQIIYSSTT
ncbi:MAG TPA: hypothetical protein VF228_03865 [Iamia sp.]